MQQNLNAKINRMLKIIVEKDNEIDRLREEIDRLREEIRKLKRGKLKKKGEK